MLYIKCCVIYCILHTFHVLCIFYGILAELQYSAVTMRYCNRCINVFVNCTVFPDIGKSTLEQIVISNTSYRHCKIYAVCDFKIPLSVLTILIL